MSLVEDSGSTRDSSFQPSHITMSNQAASSLTNRHQHSIWNIRVWLETISILQVFTKSHLSFFFFSFYLWSVLLSTTIKLNFEFLSIDFPFTFEFMTKTQRHKDMPCNGGSLLSVNLIFPLALRRVLLYAWTQAFEWQKSNLPKFVTRIFVFSQQQSCLERYIDFNGRVC